MIHHLISKAILIDCLLIITLFSSESKVSGNERRGPEVGICWNFDNEGNIDKVSCFGGNHTKYNRKYCCTDTKHNSNWTQIQYCCNIDEFADQYSINLFLALTLAVLSGVLFAIQALININIIKTTFGTNQTYLQNIIQTTEKLNDNQNDNKSKDKIKTNEQNKNKNGNNRKNSGNRKSDAKSQQNKEKPK